MRITGTETSSVFLGQTKSFQILDSDVTKTSLSQKGRCNKPTKLQFQSILTRKILML